jgi:hypothetical protein
VEILLEFVIQFFGELLVQLIFELGFHGLAEPFRSVRKTNLVFAVVCYVCAGLASGAISLLIVPKHLIDSETLRYINLIATPIMLGIFFEVLGHLRQKRGEDKLPLDRFSCGFAFAISMGLIRMVFAN